MKLGWITVPHPPYSPDLAPTDYHLFRSRSRSRSHHLREKKFGTCLLSDHNIFLVVSDLFLRENKVITKKTDQPNDSFRVARMQLCHLESHQTDYVHSALSATYVHIDTNRQKLG